MKKKMNRVLSILLVILMAFGTEAMLTAQTDLFDGILTQKSHAASMKQTISSMSVGDTVTYGSYPQTDVTSSMGSALTAAAPATGSWKSYNYYENSTQSDYMKYYDLTYNGSRYRGVYFTKYRQYYWNDSLHTYQDDSGYNTGKIYWFRYDPLTWRILDPATGYVICEYIIDSQAFNNEYYSHGTDAYGITAYYSDKTYQHLANNWEYSTIRKWLNETFFTTAFSSSERSQIPCIKLTTPACSTSYSAYDVGETVDYVFLPSYQDMLNASYGFSWNYVDYDTNRKAHSTDYAKSQGVYIVNKNFSYLYKTAKGEDTSVYRLRSACDNSNYTTGVSYNGQVSHRWDTHDFYCGIRPALCFNPSSVFDNSIGEDDDVNQSVQFGKDNSNSVWVKLNRNWFKQSSKIYNHDLARFCAAFSMLGYDKNIEAYLEQCGFKVFDPDMNASRDRVNTFVAAKRITVNGAKKNLIFVGTIGSNDRQWYSNFDPYGKDRDSDTPKTAFTDTHLGFADARDYAYGMLKKALQNNHMDENPEENILLFTGHSRGAAAANLLAAKVIDEGIWAAENSIYAYTFATPNSTTKEGIHDWKYASIFNIVNPEDFVTNVMLKSWGYDRYGITYVLPSKTNTNSNTYNKLLQKMNVDYSLYTNGEIYQPYDLGELSTWTVINEMEIIVPTVDCLYDTFHAAYSVLNLPTKFMSPFEFFKETLLKFLAEKSNEEQETAINNILRVLSSNLIGNCTSFYTSLILYFLNLDIYTIWDNLTHESIKDSFYNGLDFLKAHQMETYCAYVNSLSEEALSAKKAGLFGTINCPVDVEIIDKETDEVVGRITDNTVDKEIFAKENAVVLAVNGDTKQYWLPSDGNYEIKLIGNDSGIMDYTVSIIDSEIGETERVNFFDVPLTDNLTYSSEINSTDFSLEDYILTSENGEVITPDESFAEENKTEYTVSINVEGNGLVEGNATYTSGDYASVQAFPDENCDFLGWFMEENKVSAEPSYRFRVDSDVVLTAKFIPHEHTDNNHDGECDDCGLDLTETCTCKCHNTKGFVGFFFKIQLFFWKLFKIKKHQICECGKAHW